MKSEIIIIYFYLLLGQLQPFHLKFNRIYKKIRKYYSSLQSVDPEILHLINKEYNRQANGLELIASENFVSKAVLQALGSCLTNKYSEGLPRKRYYGGNEVIDQIELICQERAIHLFNLSNDEWGVNVQPYSGSVANFAVYSGLLNPGEKILGLGLPSGGHLSHGYRTSKNIVSLTSKYFETMAYSVDLNGYINYNELEDLTLKFKPKLIIAGASAYSREWDYKYMRKIADSVGAYLMTDMAHIAGLVATGESLSPFPYSDVVTSTTHKTLRGPRSALIFSRKFLEPSINRAVFPGLQGGPHNHQIAAVSVALKEASHPNFADYIRQVKANAKALAGELMSLGHRIATNGTDNHLFLWDVKSIGLTGSQVERLFEECSISVNKNSMPFDISAIHPSGIRIGTPAITTQGMKCREMITIAVVLSKLIKIGQEITHTKTNIDNKIEMNQFSIGLKSKKIQDQIKLLNEEVKTLSLRFPTSEI